MNQVLDYFLFCSSLRFSMTPQNVKETCRQEFIESRFPIGLHVSGFFSCMPFCTHTHTSEAAAYKTAFVCFPARIGPSLLVSLIRLTTCEVQMRLCGTRQYFVYLNINLYLLTPSGVPCI